MPVYEYTGLNSSGKTMKGILDADSPVAARHKLRGSGIFPVEVKEALSKPSGLPSSTVYLWSSQEDQARRDFCNDEATLRFIGGRSSPG